ncbi:hypothetical protein [Gilvibacter sediminis]|uniref:hypothetical protein n=1 Tax=Gilvibacter sediminis TaxID=379071 RepID=UPI00235047D5|nr:hypothetical protein [Gilvibacter sediminis]MDC7997451.1 hypothetical protein [Gilvibacter sediminis]
MNRILTTLLIAISSLSLLAQNTYQRGVIIDSLPTAGNLNETFALYLPSSYSEQQLSPIVFVFDPSGRAANGLRPFRLAAEQYGYILVSSNSNKNGPQNVNFDVANRLFNHVFSNFNIDNSRIYTAGFSGGSRLAMAIAVLTKRMQGVIACGSGFPGNVAPVGNETFSYAGIVGNLDMNYLEMHNNSRLLDALQVSNALFTYNMGHQWPTEQQLLSVFDWLQMEAHRKGIIKVEPAVINSIYTKQLSELNDPEHKDNLLGKHRAYRRLLKSFGPYLNLDSLQVAANTLRASPEFLDQQREFAKVKETEQELFANYTQQFFVDLQRKKPKTQAWKKRIDKVFRDMENSKNHFERQMLQRLLAQIGVTAYEAAFSQAASLNLEQLMFCYDLWIFVNPKNVYGYLIQMGNALKKSDQDLALDYLSQLLATGFDNYEALMNYQPIKPLHSNEEFIKLVEPLKQ